MPCSGARGACAAWVQLSRAVHGGCLGCLMAALQAGGDHYPLLCAQEGINWLAFLRRFGLHGVLADDMGLGKVGRGEGLAGPAVAPPSSILYRRPHACVLADTPGHLHHGRRHQGAAPQVCGDR